TATTPRWFQAMATRPMAVSKRVNCTSVINPSPYRRVDCQWIAGNAAGLTKFLSPDVVARTPENNRFVGIRVGSRTPVVVTRAGEREDGEGLRRARAVASCV